MFWMQTLGKAGFDGLVGFFLLKESQTMMIFHRVLQTVSNLPNEPLKIIH
jgi:hypothetical protein